MRAARITNWALTLTGLALAAGIAISAALLLGPRMPRFDVTSTGDLKLAPRTNAVLADAPPGTEVVLATRLSAPGRDPSSVRRVRDILEEIQRRHGGLAVTIIDTGAADGQSRFGGLVARLLTRDAGTVAAARQRFTEAFDATGLAGEAMIRTASALDAARGAADPDLAERLALHASRLRAAADQIPAMTAAGATMLDRRLAEQAAPDLPAARRLLTESLTALRTVVQTAATDLSQRSEAAQDEARARLSPARSTLSTLDETLASLLAAVEAAVLPASVRALGALEQSEALLILGSAGVQAVRIDDVFTPAAPGAPTPDVGRRVETLVTNAVALMAGRPSPMVVVTHASPRRILQGDGLFDALRSRSTLRGADWIEWPILLSPEEPAATAAARADGRPVVFVVIGVDASGAQGAQRVERTAAVVSSLLDRGEPVLLNLAPSTLPGLGEADPLAEVLGPLGLRADTGRPVLRAFRRGEDRLVAWEHSLLQPSGSPEGDASPLSAAIAGVPLLLPWPSVIERADGADRTARAKPILRLDPQDAWREGEWLGYWVTEAASRPLLTRKPEPGGTRDAALGEGAVAWSVQRDSGARAVVVGSHLWLFDQAADRPAVVDGRIVQTSPGNAELFLGAVDWLAGEDRAILPAAAAASTPIVQPIEPERLRLLRWLVMAGLPIGVLALGVCVRVLRG